MLVGFGFKVAAVPFHQWAPDAYEGAPAPVTAWIATGSKLASFVALMKVFVHALHPWASPTTSIMGPGWIAVVAIISAITMTYGNFAALAQKNLKRMLAYSSIAHAGYILVGVAAISASVNDSRSAGGVLYYLVVYAFANVGAFAVAAWLVRDKNTDNIDDLNGLGAQEPLLAICILISDAVLDRHSAPGRFLRQALCFHGGPQPAWFHRIDHVDVAGGTRIVQFRRVGILLRSGSQGHVPPRSGAQRLAPPGRPIALPIVVGTAVVIVLGLLPDSFMSLMQSGAVAMLTDPIKVDYKVTPVSRPAPADSSPLATRRPIVGAGKPAMNYTQQQMKGMQAIRRGAPIAPGKSGAAPGKSKSASGTGKSGPGKQAP